MRRVRGSKLLILLGALGLSACAEGAGFNLGGDTEAAAAGASTTTVTREGAQDIERPDIFTASELALWDGRPSLGGIWIAHPDVGDPERAILINESTGQRVAGALFRRERDNPGPRLQLSSDAAVALNILAGQPTEVTVVAVRREEIEVADPDPEDIDEAAEDGAEDVADAGEIDAADIAAAGIGGADGPDGTDAATATDQADAAAETPRRGTFLERIFGPRRSASAAEIAAGATAGATVGAEAASGSAGAAQIETQTLDPVASTTATAAAAIARAEADDKPVARPAQTEAAPAVETPVAAAPAPVEAAPVEAAPAPSQELRSPFIQVGLFGVEANANAAATQLREDGIVPTVSQGERDDGSSFWRVLVGPVTNAEDQAALLEQVKQAGFADAFLAPN